MNHGKWYIRTLLLLLLMQLCTSIDTLYPSHFIEDNGVLVSRNKIFVLGFFSPGSSAGIYLGIWYKNVPKQTVVWVANRDIPIKNASGILTLNTDGNLVIYNDKHRSIPIWSTNLTSSNCVAQLLDSGNLVVRQQDTKNVVWESFDHPTDTLLPHMKLGIDLRSGLNRILSSWNSLDDPGTGDWSYRLEPRGSPQLFIYKGNVKWWRAGHWNGIRWSGVPEMSRNFVFDIGLINNHDEISVAFNILNAPSLSRFVLDGYGGLHLWMWRERDKQWVGLWSVNEDKCNRYGHCGAYSICDPYDPDGSECKCLPGFEMKPNPELRLKNVSSTGCVSKSKVSMCRNGEGFIKVPNAKIPDTSFTHVDANMSSNACRGVCLNNCSCIAYASADVHGRGCITWSGALMDARVFTDSGQDLYVRVDAIGLAKQAGMTGKQSNLLITSISATVMLFLFSFLTYRLVKKLAKGSAEAKHKVLNDTDVIFFDLSTILAATNNFSAANKIGQGGFGSVYKGRLRDEYDIAVKRLSENSRQGTEEFTNEVKLIAKLQHRNLVMLLGCCVSDDERILIYEYLPNMSLDFFIFDKAKSSILDWRKRIEIILGIARGILYLHQDSRWKIIHRDIKASNILLDAEMNAKISDFGMARIFAEDQQNALTKRVVGTYGYMSPEYAMRGLYSTKSDVFSFGVLLLEIISGRKNYDFFDEDCSMTLIEHAWELWWQEKALDIGDPALKESYPAHEVLKCIHIGLLCVQECPNDRPSMLAILFMLGNETNLPPPNKPAYIFRNSIKGLNSDREENPCTNNLTLSIVLGR